MTEIEISGLHKTAQQKGTAALVVEHYINRILKIAFFASNPINMTKAT